MEYKAFRMGVKENTNQEKEKTTYFKVSQEEGIQLYRIFPPSIKEKERNPFVLKAINFLPFYNLNKGIYVKRPIPNSRIHGDLGVDLIESLFYAIMKKYGKDSKEFQTISNWKNGIGLQKQFLAYAYKIDKSKNKTFGILPLGTSLKKQVEDLCLVIDEETEEKFIEDKFALPDDGYGLVIIHDSKNPDPRQRYLVKASNNKIPLTEEDLKFLEEQKSIYSLVPSFKREDFEDQILGLENFLKMNELEYIKNEDFYKKTVEAITQKVNQVYPKQNIEEDIEEAIEDITFEEEVKEEKKTSTKSKTSEENIVARGTNQKVKSKEKEEKKEVKEEEEFNVDDWLNSLD